MSACLRRFEFDLNDPFTLVAFFQFIVWTPLVDLNQLSWQLLTSSLNMAVPLSSNSDQDETEGSALRHVNQDNGS